MATTTNMRKPSAFLLFPWGLLSIVLVLLLNTAFSNFFGKNSWIALVLIIPAAILENLKVGYSTMRVMFLKALYSCFSFMVVGLAFGAALSGWYLERFEHAENITRVHIPWYVLLTLFVILIIEIVQLFSMLKAVKREFMQFDPDQ